MPSWEFSWEAKLIALNTVSQSDSSCCCHLSSIFIFILMSEKWKEKLQTATLSRTHSVIFCADLSREIIKNFSSMNDSLCVYCFTDNTMPFLWFFSSTLFWVSQFPIQRTASDDRNKTTKQQSFFILNSYSLLSFLSNDDGGGGNSGYNSEQQSENEREREKSTHREKDVKEPWDIERGERRVSLSSSRISSASRRKGGKKETWVCLEAKVENKTAARHKNLTFSVVNFALSALTFTFACI